MVWTFAVSAAVILALKDAALKTPSYPAVITRTIRRDLLRFILLGNLQVGLAAHEINGCVPVMRRNPKFCQ